MFLAEPIQALSFISPLVLWFPNLNGIQVEGLRIADCFAEFFDKKIKATVDKVNIQLTYLRNFSSLIYTEYCMCLEM